MEDYEQFRVVKLPEIPDYLSICSEETKKVFEGKGGYSITDILLVELIIQLKIKIQKK